MSRTYFFHVSRLAGLAIAGVVDEEARKEFMKINNPNRMKIRKAADTYEKEANSNKVRADTSKAYQVRNQSNKEVICYVCGNKGHKSGECTLKRDGLKCNNCKRTGHLAKACQSKLDSGLQQKDKRKDRARVAKAEKTERPESDEIEARAVRANTNTPALLL